MRGIEAECEADLKAEERRLYGIVLLSDGRSSGGEMSETKVFSTCLPQGTEANAVKVFPIAFGADADTSLLCRVAHITRGRMYTAEASSIERAYLRISAEQ